MHHHVGLGQQNEIKGIKERANESSAKKEMTLEFVFIKTPQGATNGPLVGFVFTKYH
jgi:hypothetical protein